MRQKGKRCLPDLAPTASCMKSELCRDGLSGVLLLGERRPLRVKAEVMSCDHSVHWRQFASLEVCSHARWLLWLAPKLGC